MSYVVHGTGGGRTPEIRDLRCLLIPSLRSGESIDGEGIDWFGVGLSARAAVQDQRLHSRKRQRCWINRGGGWFSGSCRYSQCPGLVGAAVRCFAGAPLLLCSLELFAWMEFCVLIYLGFGLKDRYLGIFSLFVFLNVPFVISFIRLINFMYWFNFKGFVG